MTAPVKVPGCIHIGFSFAIPVFVFDFLDFVVFLFSTLPSPCLYPSSRDPWVPHHQQRDLCVLSKYDTCLDVFIQCLAEPLITLSRRSPISRLLRSSVRSTPDVSAVTSTTSIVVGDLRCCCRTWCSPRPKSIVDIGVFTVTGTPSLAQQCSGKIQLEIVFRKKHCSITAVAVTVFSTNAARRRPSLDMGFTDLMYAVELERPISPIPCNYW